MEGLIKLGISLVVIIIGYFLGSGRERKHFLELRRRELALLKIPATVDDWIDPETKEAFLVASSVVIAQDAFKSFTAGLRSLFGGRINAYQSLLERARREAIVRLKELAASSDAFAVVNIRFEYGGASDQTGIEVMAYGTALRK